MTLPLTEKQELVWRYIKSCERSPSYEEMARALGFSNKSQLNRLIVTLKEKGFVTYLPNRARSIVALEPSPVASAIPTAALIAELDRRGLSVVLLPLHGRIS